MQPAIFDQHSVRYRSWDFSIIYTGALWFGRMRVLFPTCTYILCKLESRDDPVSPVFTLQYYNAIGLIDLVSRSMAYSHRYTVVDTQLFQMSTKRHQRFWSDCNGHRKVLEPNRS